MGDNRIWCRNKLLLERLGDSFTNWMLSGLYRGSRQMHTADEVVENFLRHLVLTSSFQLLTCRDSVAAEKSAVDVTVTM